MFLHLSLWQPRGFTITTPKDFDTHFFLVSHSGDFFQFVTKQTIPCLQYQNYTSDFPSTKSIYLKITNYFSTEAPSQSCRISVSHLQSSQSLCSIHTSTVVSITSHKFMLQWDESVLPMFSPFPVATHNTIQLQISPRRIFYP